VFTGIVAAVGRIVKVEPTAADAAAGVTLEIDAGELSTDDVKVGESIAVNGVCLSVVSKLSGRLRFDVSRESLSRTTGLDVPGVVNLEKAVAFGERVGGHLVQGHVDGTVDIVEVRTSGESREMVVWTPAALRPFIAEKGSVALHGVSLTINRVEDRPDGCRFSVNLIPITLASTNLRDLRSGDRVNLEVDLVARYVVRALGNAIPRS